MIGPLKVIGPFAKMTAGWELLTTPAVRPTLGILGSVLSVLQVALGVQAIIEARREPPVPRSDSPPPGRGKSFASQDTGSSGSNTTSIKELA